MPTIEGRIRALKRSMEADDDPLAGINLHSRRKGTTAARPLPPEEPEVDLWDTYKPPSGETMRTTSMGGVNARDMTEKLQVIAPQITNPGMRALTEKYGGPGRSGNGIEKAKLFRFVSQMLTNNPHVDAIMMTPDLVDRFRDIAKLSRTPKTSARSGMSSRRKTSGLPARTLKKFKDNLKRLLALQGVVNAVIEPRKRP